MVKNRTAQLIFQTVYCTLGIVGAVAALGVFEDINNLHFDLYIQFTNLSNFFCLAIMFAALVKTIRRKDNGYVTVPPMLKFIGTITILFTFVIFNVLLAGAADRDPQLNWYIGSLLFHVVLPIMFVADWFLFYERRKMKWYYPFSAILFPVCYAIFIYTHAAILGFDKSIMISGTNTPLIYPYFFLDLEVQGVPGVLKWFGMFFVGLSVVGFIFFGIDKISLKKKSKDK